MACKYDENQVVIRDVETGEQTEFELVSPFKCAASMNYMAVTSAYRGLRLFTLDGDLVSIVSTSSSATCAAFHPHNANILAIGTADGSVRMRDVDAQACRRSRSTPSAFPAFASQLMVVCFSPRTTA